jgi:3-phenylpropionate/trans-cinnamate dioxygenase ferredoxin subunit
VTHVRIASSSEFEKGTMRRVEVNGFALCVARTDDGSFHAIDDRCTHENVELSDGYLIGSEVECPLHGSRFDITTGEVCGLPAELDVTVYPLTVEGDDLLAELPANPA